MSARNKILNRLFLYLTEKGVRYALMGTAAHYCDPGSGDVDFFIPENQIKDIKKRIIDFACIHNYKLVHINNYQVNGYTFTLATPVNGNTHFVSLDFASQYSKNGRIFQTQNDILPNILYDSDNGCFYINAVVAFRYYSIKKVYKNHISKEQFDYLSGLYKLAKEKYADGIPDNFFFNHLSFVLDRENYMGVQQEFPLLQKTLRQSYRVNVLSACRDAARKIRRIAVPEGRVIAPGDNHRLNEFEISTAIATMSGIFKDEKVYVGNTSGRLSLSSFFIFFKIYPQLIKGKLILLADSPPTILRKLFNCYLYQPEVRESKTELTDSFVSAMHTFYVR